MQKILIAIVSLLFLSNCKTDNKQTQKTIIKSTTKNIRYAINGEQPNNWTVTPELKPDRLNLECIKEKNTVLFFSDIDSILYTVALGDTFKFVVLLNEKDTALTEIVGIPKNATFSEEYIQQHKGKFEVEIPEVHELVNILVAISKIGQLDSNMIDMTTPYYREVLKNFLSYSTHPIIDTINHYITGVFDNKSYGYYYALKMNACGYTFDDYGQINNAGAIRHMGFGDQEDPVLKHKKLMDDFATKSKFREFYKKHHTYYDSLIVLYKQLNPIDKMQKWLEKKFEFSYGNYSVLFSPLIGGAHSTSRFKDNNFEQTFMFVCRAENSPKYNRNVNEMLESRVVFTEIDHNFVNPISDKNIEVINRIFTNREKWAKKGKGTDMYSTPYNLFNEYMTWAAFSLYCYDNFPENDVKQFVQKMENQMENSRNFIRFKSFNQELIKIYKNKPDTSMDDLYATILKWCATQ